MTTTNYRAGTQASRTMRKRAGAMLKELRVAAGKTQADVALEMGHNFYTMVSQIERGLGRLPPEDIVKYAEAYRVTPSDLAKKCLYYYDPHTYHALFGGAHPLVVEGLPLHERSLNEARRGPKKD